MYHCVHPFVMVRADDLVASVPGFSGEMPSKVYNGYLKVENVAGNQSFMAHYTLTESQRDPTKDPLVLWQQGGPGSSGFGYGWLAELGPFRYWGP